MAAIYFNDVESCCRTCLNDDSDEKYDIFTNTRDSVSLADILTMCTALKVDKTDSLPKIVCQICHDHLISFYQFRQHAEKAETSLKNRTQNNKDILIEEFSLENELVNIKSETDITHDYNIESGLDVIKTEIDCKTENDELVLELETQDDVFDINETESNSEENILQCVVCHKKFKTPTRFAKHVKKCTKPEYACTICPKKFQKHFKFMKHLLSHEKSELDISEKTEINQNESTEKFECRVCSANFRSFNSMAAHMRKHVKKGRVLACSICGKVFKKVSHVKRHELCHPENRPFKCSICSKRFNTDSLLNEHLNKHNNIKAHTCPVCNKSFAHLSTLSTHVKIHTRERRFLCPTCGKKFDCSTNLNQHMKRHMGLKTFACSMCPKKFVSKGELKSHAVTHTGERKWPCTQCTSSFTTKGSLEYHLMRHAGVRKHQCDVCPMKFVTRDHLKRHYRIHTGEKPYKCDICERAFTQSNDLVKHKKAHLGEKVYKCTQCDQGFRLRSELRQHLSEHYVNLQQNSQTVPVTKTVKGESAESSTNEIRTAESVQ